MKDTRGSSIYPNLLRRVVATLIDLAAVFAAVAFIIQRPLIQEPEAANLWAALAFVLLYEPVLTAFACTLGQACMGTRVRDAKSLERITFRKSFARFLTKYLASGLSVAATGGFVRIGPRQDRRAIHDEAGGSVVVNWNAQDR
jgi:hypothetical protein